MKATDIELIKTVIKAYYENSDDFGYLRSKAAETLDQQCNNFINILIAAIPRKYKDTEDLLFQLLTTFVFSKNLARSVKRDLELCQVEPAINIVNALLELEIKDRCI